MPIYMYQCNNCGEKAEELRPIAERSVPSDCPQCIAGVMELNPAAPSNFVMDPARSVTKPFNL